MPTHDYSANAATANRLIGKYGRDCTLRKQGAPTGPGYAPVPGATTDHPIVAADFTISHMDRDGAALVRVTTRTLLVRAAEGVAPEKDDKVLLSGDLGTDPGWYAIAEVRPLAPGGTVVLYEVDLASDA